MGIPLSFLSYLNGGLQGDIQGQQIAVQRAQAQRAAGLAQQQADSEGQLRQAQGDYFSGRNQTAQSVADTKATGAANVAMIHASPQEETAFNNLVKSLPSMDANGQQAALAAHDQQFGTNYTQNYITTGNFTPSGPGLVGQSVIDKNNAVGGMDTQRGNLFGAQATATPGLDQSIEQKNAAQGRLFGSQGNLDDKKALYQAVLTQFQPKLDNAKIGYMGAQSHLDGMRGNALQENADTQRMSVKDKAGLIQSAIGLNTARGQAILAKDPQFSQNAEVYSASQRHLSALNDQLITALKNGADKPTLDGLRGQISDADSLAAMYRGFLQNRAQGYSNGDIYGDPGYSPSAQTAPAGQSSATLTPTGAHALTGQSSPGGLVPINNDGLMYDPRTSSYYKNGVPVRMAK